MTTADAIQWSHPLHQAASEGDRDSLKQLLQDGHNPEVKGGASSWVRGAYDFLCRTPLHFAAKGGNVSCVRLLLAFGADPNAKDGDGYTPLHYTCQIHNPGPGRHKAIGQCVESLIDFGADVRSTTNFGQTPSELAQVHSNDVCRRKLEKHVREVPSLLILSRNVVSTLLHDGQLDNVDELRIPNSLKGYLHYSEVVYSWVSSENKR